jgi:hypothetical protein
MIQRARDVYSSKNVACIPVFDWREDADPAVSVKSNRQQLRCKSNTFSPPHEKQNVTDNTYIVGLGGKKQNHDPCWESNPGPQ